MNKYIGPSITTYEDLKAERERLEKLIAYQKAIVRRDIEELKEELRNELKPALEAANTIKKFTSRDTRQETLLTLGTTALVDVAVRKLVQRSNLFIQLTVPGLVKNFSSRFVSNLVHKLTHKQNDSLPVVPRNGA
jgi:hypothetical protein